MSFKNVFKKNQIIIYTFVLMLISAGYLNYTNKIKTQEVETSSQGLEENMTYEKEINSEQNIENLNESVGLVPNEDEKTIINPDVNENKNNTSNTVSKNEDNKVGAIGDATLVSSNDIVGDDYFAKSKIEREAMYSQMQETYQSILNNNNSSEAQKEMAVVELARINETKNCIMICENLLETKGFKNSIIFVNDGSVNVIIGIDELKQEQTAQIQNIISREIGAIIENIHISVKK